MTKGQGSFVFFTGLLLTMGAVGGMDTATDGQLWDSMIIALVGLSAMLVSVDSLK